MHVGRKHSRNILANHEHSGVLRQRGSKLVAVKKHTDGRSRLTEDECNTVLTFINKNQDSFDTKSACFKAALESAGATGKIKDNSVAVNRYFKMAKTIKPKVQKSVSAPKPTVQKRGSYAKKVKPVVQEVRINFCPDCGCDIHMVATGIALARAMKNEKHAK